jgi:hypothetical protein
MQSTSNNARHMVRGWFGLFAGLLAALLLTTVQGLAQTTQGSILGSVKDTTGAVIPNAQIALTNMDEGTLRTTQSNALGDYRFLDVKASHYSLSVTAAGFQKFSLTGVTLNVRQTLRLDAAMAVGEVQQEVKVTGESVSSIQTETPTISGTFTADDATNLPVNTRASFSGTSASAILGTLPGVQDDGSGISLQGALPYQTEVSIDGVTVKDPAGGSFLGEAFPSTESIAEIRADGVLASAEFGDPGQIVVTTKGGGDKYHGSAFLYYQSSAFNAIAYTFPTTVTKPSLQGKTFGGSFGGPVIIPHFYNGHNKSFFYGAYEGWRHPAQVTVNEVVPTAAMKSGDFSNYTVPDGEGGNLFTGLTNPYTGASWGTQVPSGSINTIAASTLSTFYPDPNVTGMTTSYADGQDANYQRNVDKSGSSNQFDVRGDQYFGSNQKFLIWGRFTWKNAPTSSEQILNLPSSQDNTQSRVMRVDTNWSIKPNLINEGGFGMTRVTSGGSNSFDGKAWTEAQGWIGLQNLFFNGIPNMSFNNMQSLDADRLTGLNKSFTYEYNDTLMWNKGNHTFKFGVNIQQLEALSPLGFNGADNYGSYDFYSSGSEGMFTGVDFGDFLLGLPNQTFYDVVKQDNDGISGHYNVFAQDEWKVSPKLTLTYGVRYELHPGYHDKYGDIGNFDTGVALSGRAIYPQGKQDLLSQAFLASANACDPDGINNTNSATVNGAPCMPVEGNETAGFPSGLKKFPHLRFMPRFGFAYRPFADDKWAIRGGFGLYNINMLGSSFYSLTGTLQAQTQQFQNTYDSTTHAIGYQWPQVYAGTGDSGAGSYGTAYFGTANSINWKDPYTEQWALSIDHDLGSGYAVRASYIGSNTRQLVWAPDLNTLPFSSTVSAYNAPIASRRFPNWGRINSRETGANESYHSFQLEASHRMQQGLEFHSGFTWAKALADNQGPTATGFGGENGGSRASSILDRHVDYGPAYGTRKLRWNTTALYDLPFGRGKMIGGGMNRLADLIAGGWRLSSILTIQTGPYETPYFPSGQGDPSGTGSGLNGALGDGTGSFDTGHRDQHPDRVSSVDTKPTGQNRLAWTNANAFACPGDSSWTPGTSCTTGSGTGPSPLPIGRFGNAGVGSVVGPGLINLSAGLSKGFVITEGLRLKLEGTFTNVLNHTNLSDPNMNLSSASFGRITKSISSDFGGARTGQVSARFEF